MGWQRVGTLLVAVVGVLGCGTEREGVVAGEPPSGPEFRAQKPETAQAPGNKPILSLDIRNEQFNGPAGGEVAARILANVNGIPILYEEVQQVCYPMLREIESLPEPERSARQKDIINKQLQGIIEREIILQDAMNRISKNPQALKHLKEAAEKEFDRQMRGLKTRNHISSDEQFRAILKAQGASLDVMKRQSERSFMATEYMRSRVYRLIERIGHPEILEYYQEHQSDFRIEDGVHWQDIFIDASRYPSRDAAKATALSLITRAKAGEDFVKLVKQYDNGDSSYREGEGFGVKPGEIRPVEAEPVLFQMKDGEIGPVIEISTGFHVVRLGKRDVAGVLPFDEKVQSECRRRLQNEMGEKEYRRLLNELKQKAVIEFAHGS